VNGFWAAAGLTQQVAIALGGAWNATYFALRMRQGSRARRVAAGVLTLLFAGIAVETAAGVPVSATASEVVRRTPLLLATVAIAFLVSFRPTCVHAGGAR